MPVLELPAGRAATSVRPVLDGERHPARRLLEDLLDGAPPDDAAAAGLRQEYERQSADWAAWTATQADYVTPLLDLLERVPGAIGPDDVVLDVGTGTGETLAALLATGALVIALDIARPMIKQVVPRERLLRLQSDVLALPVASASVDVIVGLNSVPCWSEFRRTLRNSGRLVWLSSFGPDTPLFVPPDVMSSALCDADVVWARAGHGSWSLAEGVACIA